MEKCILENGRTDATNIAEARARSLYPLGMELSHQLRVHVRSWTVQNDIDSKDQMKYKVLLLVGSQLRGGEL